MADKAWCGVVLAAIIGLVGLLWPASASAGDGDAVVIVNGKSISRRVLVDRLMESHGLPLMQQLVVLELAKQETARLKLEVTQGDIDAELKRALARLAPQAADEKLSSDEQRQALDFLLQQKGISYTEFMLGMERNAHLRKAVERDIQIDEATLREEFARVHGEKVEIRHIQLQKGDVNALHEALNQIRNGTDFEQVARQVSQNAETAARGGLLEPFTFSDNNVAPVLREAAFSMKEGEISAPIEVGRWLHIIKLERRVAPGAVQFEDVRADVERELRERVATDEMNRRITELFSKAEIRVLDSDLRKKFEALLKQNQIPDATPQPTDAEKKPADEEKKPADAGKKPTKPRKKP